MEQKNVDRLVAFVVFFIVVWFFSVAQARVAGFVLTSGDTAVAEEALWNTVHGDWFYQSSLYTLPTNFREHVNFIQFVFLPFYFLVPSLLTLYAVINAAYGIVAYVFYRFARREVGTVAGFVLALFFLLQPVAAIQNIDAMHVVTLGAPLLLLAFIFYEEQRYRLWLGFMLAACLTTEFMAPTIFLFGLLALWDRRAIKWVWPPVVASTAMYLASAAYITTGFSENGSVLKSFTQTDHLGIREGRVKQFLSPALYVLPFLSKYVFFLAPTVLVALFVANVNRLYPGSHLLSLVPPILAMAMYDVLRKWRSARVRGAILVLLVIGLAMAWPIWDKMADTTPNPRASTMREAVSWVVDDGSVTTARIMGVALNHRHDFYLLDNVCLSDYMVIDRRTGEYAADDRHDFDDSFEHSADYVQVMDRDDIAVYISRQRISTILGRSMADIDSAPVETLVREVGALRKK